jgi:hypothetical protein
VVGIKPGECKGLGFVQGLGGVLIHRSIGSICKNHKINPNEIRKVEVAKQNIPIRIHHLDKESAFLKRLFNPVNIKMSPPFATDSMEVAIALIEKRISDSSLFKLKARIILPSKPIIAPMS